MTKKTPILRFPKQFLWGAATSSHQVEGNTHNNWTVWELENAKALAKAAEYKLNELPVWPEIKDVASDPANYVSGEAVDHYNRYELDFDIAKNLNLNAFRFSIEWSRIEPEEGRWDPAEVEHYRQYIAALKKRGLEPMMTLYHWTLPTWFADKGGFEKASNIHYFTRYAEKVLEEFGAEVRYITTINEPDTVVLHSYGFADYPPQTHSYLKMAWTYRNMLKAHKRVYKLGKRMSRRYKIGFTKGYAWVRAGDDRRLTKFAVWLDFLVRDDWVLWYVGRQTAFIGVNYYFSDRHMGFQIEDETDKVNDMGWEMRPDDLYLVLKRLARRKKPLIITESGVSDRNDAYRHWWIGQCVISMQRALDDGVPLEGYLHWALLDNFEWTYGKWPRFGLVAIDYNNNLKRTVRKSGLYYAKLVKKIRGVS